MPPPLYPPSGRQAWGPGNPSTYPQTVIPDLNGVATNSGITARILPDSTKVGSVDPERDLIPFDLSQISATDPNGGSVTYVISGKAVQLPGGSTVMVAQDGSVLLNLPSGSLLQINTTQILTSLGLVGATSTLAQPVTAYVTPLLQSAAQNAVVAGALTVGSSALPPIADDAALAVVSGPLASAVSRQVTQYVPTLVSDVVSAVTKEAVVTADANLAIKALGGQLQDAASKIAASTLFSGVATAIGAFFNRNQQNQQQDQQQQNNSNVSRNNKGNDDPDRTEGETKCLQDVPPVIKICAAPPVYFKIGTGDVPDAFNSGGFQGAWATGSAATGMAGALGTVHPLTGTLLPSFVDLMLFPQVDQYDAYTTSGPYTLRTPPDYLGGPWTEPVEYIGAWPGRDPKVWAKINAPGGTSSRSVNGILTSGPSVDAAGGAGLRIGVRAARIQGVSLEFGVPVPAQVHWYQAVAGDSGIAIFLYQKANPLLVTTAQVKATLFSTLADPLTLWFADNGVSLSDPFYDTKKLDGLVFPGTPQPYTNPGGAANGLWFIDQPLTFNKPLRYAFCLCAAWYLKPDRRTPSDVPTTYLAGASPTLPVFVTNWYGIDWYAAVGDPQGEVLGWQAAVGADAGYSPPVHPLSPYIDGNRHFRNDFVLTQAAAGYLMCTLAQATAADAALAQMLQDHGGGGQFGAFTVDTPVPIPYTPIALSRQAVVYQYAVAPANTDPKMFFELP